jgi:glycosyltransferase involved in cell wall biosynthesis
MKTVIVIPAYNEARNIGAVLKDVRKYAKTVIVVDDGSKDATSDVARKYATLALKHRVNMGKGRALATGIQAALAEYPDAIITMDSDGQHEPKDIPRLLAALAKADIAIGTRQLDSSMPLVFRLGNAVIRQTFRTLFGTLVHDTQSGFRAYRTGIVRKLAWETSGYAADTEILVQAIRKDARLAEVPIKTIYRDTYKGTTVMDGIRIVLRMIGWKLGI